ncbi:glycosyltransferase family 10 [bacterium]|nr:glycosyltransferase family 10 [bacterium]
MKKTTFFTGNYYLNNKQFDVFDKNFNTNDCMYGFYMLREKFLENDIDLSTQDINPIKDSEFIIYNDMPESKYIVPDNYLLLIESRIVYPENWDLEKHKYFKKIFTWDDTLIDGKKYFKINYSHKIPKTFDINISQKNKLCVMVNSNKYYKHPLELYSERIKAIRWFEKHHSEDFDLYGFGWDKAVFKGVLKRLNRFDKLAKVLAPRRSSFKFPAPASEVMSNYKFSICYENGRDIPGYITEKIFNSFFAGCVPVYFGAPNITDYIPANTFIDKRNFKNYEELYRYLKDMRDSEYIRYLDSIKNFVLSDKIYPFSAECFVETLFKEIVEKFSEN